MNTPGKKVNVKVIEQINDVEIRDIENLLSKIITHSPIIKNELIDSLDKAFEDDTDKLRPLPLLSVLPTETENFLVKQPYRKRIQSLILLVAATASALLAIIQFSVRKNIE